MGKPENTSTITAPITAPGASGVAVVRVSGPLTKDIVMKLSPKGEEILSSPRLQVFSEVLDLLSNTTLDAGLITFFPGPNSFTGEDVAEFSIHGGTFLVSRLLQNITALGAELARAGEFTERAFLNGKIDLSQAEAVSDLIAAETEAQAKVAYEQLEGKLSQAISDLGDPLRDTVAEIEAYIDFPDEDIDPLSYEGWRAGLKVSKEKIREYIRSYSAGRLYREGARVSIVGLPNAGKSSLLNKLVGEERAIVTPIAGTTRDSIEERVSLGGLYVRFFDTAGLFDESNVGHVPDTVEKLGIERSWKEAKLSDMALYVFDVSAEFENEQGLFLKVKEMVPSVLAVGNKSDLGLSRSKEAQKIFGEETIFVSAFSGEGIEELSQRIREKLLGSEQKRETVLITTARHVEALKRAEEALIKAEEGISKRIPPEFISADVRAALGALSDIVGVTCTEEILGRIFSKFCIGK